MSKSNKSKLNYSLSLFSEAVDRFEEAVKIPVTGTNSLVIDASIQRFEFSFEMSWKTLKRFLEYKGVSAKTPRDVFKEAFKLGLLKEGDDLWSQMIEDRNQTSHTYNRQIAQKVYSNLASYLKAYNNLNQTLQTILDQVTD